MLLAVSTDGVRLMCLLPSPRPCSCDQRCCIAALPRSWLQITIWQTIHSVFCSRRDDRHFARATLSAGTSLGRLPEKNAALGAGLKLSTGTLFWNGGVRVPLPAPSDNLPRQSFWHRLRHGAQSISSPRIEGTSVAPSGVRASLSHVDQLKVFFQTS